MSDPLHHRTITRVSTSPLSSLKFTKLLSPKMKSVYWPYFGYPTNEHDRIITKQNVVCTVCHKVLTNHGNTTNLRAHLQHRHKDIFNKICEENGIKIPPRRIHQKPSMKRDIPEKKVKLEYSEGAQDSSNNTSVGGEDHAILYETMVPITYEDDEVIDSSHFAKIEVRGGGVAAGRRVDGTIEADVSSNKIKNPIANYRDDVIEEIDPFQLQESVVNMLIQDLRNVDTLYDGGMQQLLRSISTSLPNKNKVEAIIREMHSDKLTTLGDQIKMHSHMRPYSLGFDVWTNVEQKQFLSIYCNYTTETPEFNLLNQLYATIEYNKYTSIETTFEEFNLQNCTAAILSYDNDELEDDYLKQFLDSKNIPTILAYDITIDKCLRNVLGLPSVSSVIDEVKEVIMRYSSEINSKDVEIPIVNNDFPWTYFELLKFFAESVSWPEELDALVTTTRTIVEALQTLSVTLDTLKGEEIPHSSMLSPITSKILNKRLTVSHDDDSLVLAIKTSIISEFQKYVLLDDQLTISGLLDPRFHRLTNINNLNSCLDILTAKFQKICEVDGCMPSASSSPPTSTSALTKRAAIKKENLSGYKKSNLELFFDIQEPIEEKPMQDENNIEKDLKRYRNEVYVSLDESPFIWWNKMGHVYGSLKKLAMHYQCVPSIVHMGFKRPIRDQINEYQKRYMLTGNLIDPLLFLHYNDGHIISESYSNLQSVLINEDGESKQQDDESIDGNNSG